MTGNKKKKASVLGRICYALAVFLGFLLFFSMIILGTIVFLNSPPPQTEKSYENDSVTADNSVLFEIRRGETARSVGNRLEEAGLIRSRHFWFALTRFQDEYIKTGTYRLDPPLSQMAIYRILI